MIYPSHTADSRFTACWHISLGQERESPYKCKRYVGDMGPGVSRLEGGGRPQTHVAPPEGGRARGGAAAAPSQLEGGGRPQTHVAPPEGGRAQGEAGQQRRLPPPS
jgi:hypothetical protein